MTDFFEKIFSKNFMPHGHCYFWTPEILWLHSISDVVIFISYYSIPITLIYFIRKKRDLPFHWVFWMFGGFILLCGTTHIMSVYTTWTGAYGSEGIVKALTAIFSATTAVALWPILPRVLALGSVVDLSEAQEKLNKIHEETKVQYELLQKNSETLNTFTKSTVSRELQMIELKKKINLLSKELGRPEPFDLSIVERKS